MLQLFVLVEMTSESGSVEHHQATQADEEEEEEESIDILDGPTQGLQGHNVNRSGNHKMM